MVNDSLNPITDREKVLWMAAYEKGARDAIIRQQQIGQAQDIMEQIAAKIFALTNTDKPKDWNDAIHAAVTIFRRELISDTIPMADSSLAKRPIFGEWKKEKSQSRGELDSFTPAAFPSGNSETIEQHLEKAGDCIRKQGETGTPIPLLSDAEKKIMISCKGKYLPSGQHTNLEEMNDKM